jgi:PEGA domain-containing protein
MKRLMMLGIVSAILMAPLAAYARPGRVIVAPAYGWGWYGPYWGPYPYGYGYYGYATATGAVKFDTSVKDAEVYIDGAYAGTVGKLKTMNLKPGSYDFEVRAPGRTQFDKKVYVAAGKTLHLNPDLRVQAQPQTP